MFITLNSATCAWSGMWAQSQASVYTISVGTEQMPNYPWAHNTLPERAGVFKKNTLHHTEQIQPHASLWELADDIYPHINTLRILSGLSGVQIVPPEPILLEIVVMIWTPASST